MDLQWEKAVSSTSGSINMQALLCSELKEMFSQRYTMWLRCCIIILNIIYVKNILICAGLHLHVAVQVDFVGWKVHLSEAVPSMYPKLQLLEAEICILTLIRIHVLTNILKRTVSWCCIDNWVFSVNSLPTILYVV